MSAIRWTIRNVGALLISFILAVTVWASAVVTADPNQDGTYQAAPIEIVGQAADLLLTNDIPEHAVLTIKAPRSIWEQLNKDPSLVRVWIDLSGLAAGEHGVEVNAQVALNPVRIVKVDPAVVKVVLEPFTTKSFPVKLQVKGDPPLGFQKGAPLATPELISVSGPASAVDRVAEIIATLDVTGASQTVKTILPVHAMDETGAGVPEVAVNPKEVSVVQPISILGGYKNVAVKVLTKGQVASGYRLSNISVTPPTVTVYSSDPKFVNELPGYVETMPVDLAGLNDDTEFNIALNLPEELSLVSEPSVLVQIGVAAIEGSLTLSLPVEPLGLPPSLMAIISPHTVDVIVTGPLPVLDTLSPASFRAVVDLSLLAEGIYQIAPTLDLIPEEVQIQAILPETVEVTISLSPTSTPTSQVTGTPKIKLPSTPSPTPRP
jgi:YbbR domain-containing protein